MVRFQRVLNVAEVAFVCCVLYCPLVIVPVKVHLETGFMQYRSASGLNVTLTSQCQMEPEV